MYVINLAIFNKIFTKTFHVLNFFSSIFSYLILVLMVNVTITFGL